MPVASAVVGFRTWRVGRGAESGCVSSFHLFTLRQMGNIVEEYEVLAWSLLGLAARGYGGMKTGVLMVVGRLSGT
jgi:hypothetical protein